MKPMDMNNGNGKAVRNINKTQLATLIGILCVSTSANVVAEQLEKKEPQKKQDKAHTHGHKKIAGQ